jgi:hypothetical protein
MSTTSQPLSCADRGPLGEDRPVASSLRETQRRFERAFGEEKVRVLRATLDYGSCRSSLSRSMANHRHANAEVRPHRFRLSRKNSIEGSSLLRSPTTSTVRQMSESDYVALPFVPSDDGIAAVEAFECVNPNSSVMKAEALSRKRRRNALSRSGEAKWQVGARSPSNLPELSSAIKANDLVGERRCWK